MQLIIGLTGRKRHGKSFFCDYVKERLISDGRSVECINFKDPLLALALSIGWDGKKDEKGRLLLQRLGTDVVRECIDTNYWVKRWSERVAACHTLVVLVDDVRFQNEAEAIKNFNSILVRVITPDQDGEIDNHPSEAGINPFYVDVTYNMRYGLKHIRSTVEEFYGTYILQNRRLGDISG